MNDLKDLKKVCQYYKSLIEQISPDGNYDIVGHSFGALIGVHLERKHLSMKNLILLDPFDTDFRKESKEEDERLILVFMYLSSYMPQRINAQIQKEVLEIKGEQARINKIVELMKHYGGKHLVGKEYEDIIRGSFERADMMTKYKRKNMEKLNVFEYKGKQIIKKKLKDTKTRFTLIKLTRKEINPEIVETQLRKSFGFKKEVCCEFLF